MKTNETTVNPVTQAPAAVAPAAPLAAPQPPVAAVTVTPAPVANPVAAKPRKGGKKNKIPAVTSAL